MSHNLCKTGLCSFNASLQNQENFANALITTFHLKSCMERPLRENTLAFQSFLSSQ